LAAVEKKLGSQGVNQKAGRKSISVMQQWLLSNELLQVRKKKAGRLELPCRESEEEILPF
jgi:hypothetical protein